LGTVPASGSGWTLTTSSNTTTGDIGIDLYSATGTPIQNTAGGSLVTIALHVRDIVPTGSTGLSFVTQTNPTGSRVYTTTVGDVRGAYVIHTVDGGQWTVSGGETPSIAEQPTFLVGTVPPAREKALVVVEPTFETQPEKDDDVPKRNADPELADQVLAYLEQAVMQENALGQPGAVFISEPNDQMPTGVRDEALQVAPGARAQQDWVADDYVAYLLESVRRGLLVSTLEFLDGGMSPLEGD